jgi:hypothetical protein
VAPDAMSYPTLVIGVVGHRPNAFGQADGPRLRDQVRSILRLVCRLGTGVSLISPLAEGADRLVAHEALAIGLPLRCLLPFARDVYPEDFTTQESIDDYLDLLERAHSVCELPGVHGTDEERDAAYAALSDELLDRINLLLAIWDGDEARGIGGTANTVYAAVDRQMPVIWINSNPPHDALLLSAGAGGTFHVEPLDRLPAQLSTHPARNTLRS